MFGIFTRLKDAEDAIIRLEKEIVSLNQSHLCSRDKHSYVLDSYRDPKDVFCRRWISGKKCTNCGKFVELSEVDK